MPRTKIALYREDDGTVPLLAWLDSIPDKARDKCVVRIERLREQGHELRRPEADFLRDGIYELRWRCRESTTACCIFSTGGKLLSCLTDSSKNAKFRRRRLIGPLSEN